MCDEMFGKWLKMINLLYNYLIINEINEISVSLITKAGRGQKEKEKQKEKLLPWFLRVLCTTQGQFRSFTSVIVYIFLMIILINLDWKKSKKIVF